MRKAQVATEYIAIVGFVTFAVLLLTTAAYFYQRQVANQVVINQVDRLARELVDAAESVYFLGAPSKTTIKVEIPKNIEGISIEKNTVLFIVNTPQGQTSISYRSSVPLRISGEGIAEFEGLHSITLETICSSIDCNSKPGESECCVDITG